MPADQPKKLPLTLTERLAAERTDLANERTLLSYVRTGLALIATGTGFGQFLDSALFRNLFLLFIPVGAVVLIVGVTRYWQRRRMLNQYRR